DDFQPPRLHGPALRRRARRPLRPRAGRRRSPRGVLLHHQPPHLRARGRPVAHAARAAHGLRARPRRRRRALDSRGAAGARRRPRRRRAGGGRAGGDLRPRRRVRRRARPRGRVQVHDERGVAREADRLRAHGPHPRGRAGAGRLPRLGRGAGAGALARAGGHGVVRRQRLRRRAARRERRRGARHRGVHLRHDARDERHRRRDQRRARAAHARDQPRARRGLDRARGGAGGDHRRHHARVRAPGRALRPLRLDPRRRPAAGRVHRRRGRPGRDARAHDEGDDGHPRRHGAARDRDGEHAPRVRHRAGRRAPRARDDLRRLVGVRREQAQGPGHPPGVRRRHERAGLHAHPPALRRARAGRAARPRGRARRRRGGRR
ncbi:MAG: Uncharacterized protein MJ1480, partial [uncultured Gemmatimonadaceae bacterium]